MSSTPRNPPAEDGGGCRYDVTRIALIDALGNLPLGEHLHLEPRGRFADALLAQMPVASAAGFYMEGVKAERERIYAELGNDHYVTFTEDRWSVEHSVECRLSGQMHECAWHEAVATVAHDMDEPDPQMFGRWRITGISEGLPDLERVEPQP